MKTPSRQLLKEIAARHPPGEFYSCADFFKKLYQGAKESLDSYSYRQLAVDLGFTATNVMHLIIQGKRNVSEKAAHQIAGLLNLRHDQRRYFLALAQITREKTPDDVNATFRKALEIRSDMISSKLEQEQYSYYAEWYHSVIREMLILPDFVCDPAWISQHIFPSITQKQAEESLELLKKFDLIRFDEASGRWVQTDTTISTGPEVLSLVVQKYHQDSIPQGLSALASIPNQDRHISALVLSLSKSQFERVKQEIEIFQQKLLDLEKERDTEDPDRIVRLNMQLFPSCLTRRT